MKSVMDDQIRALIVDDEDDVCYLLSAILKHKNLKAKYVGSLRDAKRVLMEDNPSIIFLDNHLPDGFGVNFIEEIKRLYPHVKIVMITAHDTTADKDKAYLEGVDQFIGKPFTRDVIFRTLENLLN